MEKSDFVGFRASPDDRKRLRELKQKTGLGMSEILRTLVHTAQLESVQTYKIASAGLPPKNSACGVSTTTSADVSVRN